MLDLPCIYSMLPGPEYSEISEDLHWPSRATETVIRQQYLCHDDGPFVMDVTHQPFAAVGLSEVTVVRRGAFAAQSRNNVRVQVRIS